MKVRPRKTDRGIKDTRVLLSAIKEVKLQNKKYCTVAKAYNIPKSSLHRYLKRLDKDVADISQIGDDAFLTILTRCSSFTGPTVC